MSSSEVPVTNAAVSCQTGNASHQQRDMLRAHEIELQERWRLKRVFEVDAGDALKRSEKDKYFVSFPMAYMNGALHLGHGFTLTKAEFAAGYQRLRGKAVLFPFAYHCTGMPIQAAADRLKKEIATFGCPPNFNKEDEDTTKVAATSSMNSSSGVEEKGGVKKRGGRSKVAAKASKASYQWNILREIGIPESEIPKFVDSIHWLRHFPTLAARDLRALGFSCDYRRSFITTSCNPYFDSFVRFQMETLHERGKLSFGGRLTIFSPVENQPCADHDRAVGEGVGVLETTAVKLRLSHPYPAAIQSLLAQAENARFKDWSIFLPASTFRPETMYGQTNVFVLPEGEYGMYEMNNGQLFICSPQSALNWSYQNQTPVRGQPFCLGKVHGSHLMGFSVHAPLSVYGRVHILPLSSIDMSKGTGVVTSVPSDAPDDYAALMDLIRKPAWRAKHGITLDMVEPFKVVPVIETPGFGNQPAADLCEKLGVSGQNDSVKLAQIKEQVYREGFNNGIMLKGEYAGSRVSEAKARIRDDLIRSGDALPYAEPESLVLSRSQTTCVVALCDQWLINYGEPKWQQAVRDHVVSGGLQTFNAPSHQAFVNGIDWLREWACSRIYGLGSFLPWDPQYVIESLSDSTVYMAYYTVSHLLQGPICDAEAAPVDNTAWLGSKPGPFGIQASELNEHVWRYILMRKEYPDYPAGKTSISEAVLERLRNEFEYWYPLNLRVSGKDLVPNHLTMCLYTHAAMWPEESLTRWPRSYFVNGFTSVDSQKMSKSVGNFITMRQAVEEFGADATRFALADAGDGLEEANFERAIARGAVTKLVRELMWVRSNLNSAVNRTGAFNFHDEVFQHRIFACVAAAQQSYEDFRFRDALKAAFFDLVSARDVYKSSLREDGEELHAKLVKDFIHTLCVLLAPICPHFSQQVWDEAGFAAEEGIEFVAKAKWPDTPMPDQEVLRRATYLQSTAAAVRKAAQDLLLRAAKRHAKAGSMPIEQPSLESEPCAGKVHLHVFVAIRAPEWQVRVLQVLRELWQQHGNGLTREILQKHMRSDLGASADRTGTSDSKADRERSIKYAAELLVDLQATTSDAEAAIVLQSISPPESRLSHASSASSSPVAYCSEQQLLEVHAVRVCRGQGQLHIHAFDPSEEGMKAIISTIAPSDPVLPSILAKATPNKPSVFARMM